MANRSAIDAGHALDAAVALHQQGRLAEAEQLYQSVLKAQPKNFHALHLMGIVRAQQARPAEAVASFRKALAIDPRSAEAHSNLGNALQALNRHGEAIASYDRAVALKPGYPEAHNFRGNSLQALKRHDDAIASYDRALAARPDYAEALYNRAHALNALKRHAEAVADSDKALAIQPRYPDALNVRGIALQALGRGDEAIASYDRALAQRPQYAAALCNRGVALLALGRHGEAMASFERALAIEPEHAGAHCGRADALSALGRHDEAVAGYDRALAIAPADATVHYGRGAALQAAQRHLEAIDSYDRALALRPAYFEAHHNRGKALQSLNRDGDAMACYKAALAIDPEVAETHNNLANALLALNCCEEAIACYARAIALRPDYAEAHTNQALAYLKLRDFAHGWEKYAWRWRKPDFAARSAREFRQPPWPGPGASGTGSRLLVWGEQGIGDEILYASMIPDLIALGAQVVVETDPRLVPLFARSFHGAEVVARTSPPAAAAADPAIDYQVAGGDLGRWLRRSMADFPQRDAFLAPDAERARQFRRRLDAHGAAPVVGLAWKSRGLQHKSLSPRDLAPLVAGARALFVDLQYGDTRAERAELNALTGRDIVHFDDVDLYNDIDGAVALTAACDLVITSSNVVAHFAGAIGTPVWVLLPLSGGLLWYWFCDGETSPWYRSAHLFRQQQADDWQGVVDEVARRLGTLVSSR